MWSQQQKLIADDVYDATHTPLPGTTVASNFVNNLVKKFGYDVTVWEGRLAVTYNKEDAVPVILVVVVSNSPALILPVMLFYCTGKC
jgi:hypothetical protein